MARHLTDRHVFCLLAPHLHLHTASENFVSFSQEFASINADRKGHSMTRLTLALLATGVLAAVGCENKSPPGGPGAPKPSGTAPTVGTPDNTFTVSVPSATLKQGESKTITVSIKRGTNFDQDVKLEVENAPQGVTFKFDESTLRASATEVHLTIDASKDAALGEHKVMIAATPARAGTATQTEMKVEVKKP
jgi:hypothetical protein